MLSVVCLTATNALASDEKADLSATQIKVEINKTGDQTGVATLDKTIYYAGDSAVLTWRGACVGDDFVIPKSISYNNTSIDLATLNKMDSMQTANDEYARRMGSSSTMTTYDSIKNFITKNNTVALPNLTIDTVVTVEFVKVSPVYRMYNMISSEHLFSTNKVEYDNWVEIGRQDKDAWVGEGIDWLAPTAETSDMVIHRLYNPGLGAMGHSSHYYTADAVEMTNLMSNYGWQDDGEDNYIRSGGTQSIYTCYNEGLGSAHHYSSSQTEWEGLEQHQWQLERDKNGDTGVFQGVAAVRWYTPSSYYTVYHQLENLDGTYSTYETQTIQGAPGSQTDAKAKEYAGYTAQSFYQTTVDAANITKITIKYSRNIYTVSFNGNGQDIKVEDQKVRYGATTTSPTTPNAADYNFVGWYWDTEGEQPFDFGSQAMGLNNITLYAKWVPVNYSIYKVRHIYQRVDGSWPRDIQDGNMIVEEKQGKPGNLTEAEAKELTGLTAQAFEQVTIAEGQETLVDINYDRAKFTLKIDYQGHGGVENPKGQPLFYEQEFTMPVDPADEQYKFLGWYTDAGLKTKFEGTGTIKMPLSDLTLYAGWREKDKPTVTFATNGGSEIERVQVTAGQSVKKPVDGATTRAGYDFIAWYSNIELTEDFDFTAPINDDTTIYAKWKARSDTPYKIEHKTQNLDGTTYTTVYTESKVGTSGQIPSIFVKEYTGFDSPEAPRVAINGDGTTVIEVKYNRTQFSVSFSANKAGLSDPATLPGVLYGAKITAPTAELSAIGYKFDGWYDGDKKWDFENDTVTSNIALQARWSEVDYKITYHLGSDKATNEGNPETYKYGEGVASFVDPVRPGVTFDGWYTEDDKKVTSIDTNQYGDITLIAKWKETLITIKYDKKTTDPSVTGTFTEQTNLSSDSSVTLRGNDVDRDDLVLEGWTLEYNQTADVTVYKAGQTVAVADLMSAVDSTNTITLYAKWGNAIKVTFDMNDHGSKKSIVQKVISGLTAKELTEEEIGDEPGLMFEGWYTDENCLEDTKWDFNTTITEPQTLYANWIPDYDKNTYWLAQSSVITKPLETGRDADYKLVYQTNTNYVREEWNVELSAAEIRADVKVLKAGDVETNPTYTEVKERWEWYMKGDSYHLYTRITDDQTDTSKNAYMEFAVLQVGPHTSIGDKSGVADEETGVVDKYTDESTISFMAIYSLPESYAMAETDTDSGGWPKYKLRNMLQPTGAEDGLGTGEIYNLFRKGLTNDITPVTKWTMEGYSAKSGKSETRLSSQDKFWVMSLSELSNGGHSRGYSAYEGDQYARMAYLNYNGFERSYWSYNGLTTHGSLPLLKLGYTRDYSKARSVYTRSTYLYALSYTDGNVKNNYVLSTQYGGWYSQGNGHWSFNSSARSSVANVAPCFAF